MINKIVIAIDSFKESVSSIEAAQSIKKGFNSVMPDARVVIKPLADGGEGTSEAILYSRNGEWQSIDVSDPLGRTVTAKYAVADGTTAVIEAAAAAGIMLLNQNEKDPMKTTTYGIGQMILHAVQKGCRNFIIGLGGSATNDGGCGMLAALGYRFSDKSGREILPGCRGLKDLYKIESDGVNPLIRECTFTVACDVTNPLCGDYGCSRVFAPQKGAREEDIALMDGYLKNYAEISKTINPNAEMYMPGSGAAGGLGFAFCTYLNARLVSGTDMIISATELEKEIKDADLCITGEGRIDGQTAMGKGPGGVARLAKKYNKTVIAFCGCEGENAQSCNYNGIDAFFPVIRKPVTLAEALSVENAKSNIYNTAVQVASLIKQLDEIKE